MPTRFKPFADEAASTAIGGMTVENRVDRVSLFGSLDLTRDREGLERARALQELVARVLREMEAAELPERVKVGEKTDRTANPFG